jgi:iron complex transport system permease protein
VRRGGGRADDGAADLLVMLSPEALRGKQVFLLGSTSFLGWSSVAVLAASLAAGAAAGGALARALDALVLGDATAASLGLPLPRLRLLLVALMALATGTAVAQVGLVAFVGLVAPHLVRRWSPSRTARCWRCRRWPAACCCWPPTWPRAA